MEQLATTLNEKKANPLYDYTLLLNSFYFLHL